MAAAAAARQGRWDLLNRARSFLPKRPGTCALFVWDERLRARRHAGRGSVYGRVMCGHRACPPCSCRVGCAKAAELESAMVQWHVGGGRCVHVVPTMSHDAGMSLGWLLGVFNRSRRSMHGRAAWERLMASAGVAHWYRSAEQPWNGWHGWHPHEHMVLFLTAEGARRFADPRFFLRWWQGLTGVWADSVTSVAPECAPERERLGVGVEVRFVPLGGEGDLAGYVHKDAVHGLAMEVCRGDGKKGHGESKSPFELLAAAVDGDRRARDLFGEWTAAVHKKHLQRWSDGAREFFGLGVQKTDEELANEADESPAEVDEELTVDESALVTWAPELTGPVADAVERGGAEEVHRVLGAGLALLSWRERAALRRWYRARVIGRETFRRRRRAKPPPVETRREVRSQLLGVW